MRLLRFVRSVWHCRRLLTCHNLRALWIQSDPRWREKLPPLDLTDEERERFHEAIES